MFSVLTHWGRVTHICVGNLTIIGSDNGLSPGRRQAIIWTNAGILLIGPLGTNFSEILIKIITFSFKKMRLKVSSAKRRPFCLGLNVLRTEYCHYIWFLVPYPVISSLDETWLLPPDGEMGTTVTIWLILKLLFSNKCILNERLWEHW